MAADEWRVTMLGSRGGQSEAAATGPFNASSTDSFRGHNIWSFFAEHLLDAQGYLSVSGR